MPRLKKNPYLYRLTALSKRQRQGVQFLWKEIKFVLIIQKSHEKYSAAILKKNEDLDVVPFQTMLD